MLLAMLLNLFADGTALMDHSVIDFGTTRSWIKLDVQNNSGNTIDGINVNASPRFYAHTCYCDNLAPAQSCAIWIKFRPLGSGSYDGTLTLDDGTSSRQLPLRGIYHSDF